MTKSTPGDAAPVRRIDRILAFMSLGITLLAIISFFAIMIGSAVGVTDFDSGIWPLVAVVPLVGLPLAFVLIFALLVMSFVRRSREGKAGA